MKKICFIGQRERLLFVTLLCLLAVSTFALGGCAENKSNNTATTQITGVPTEDTAVPAETTEPTTAPTESVDYSADAPETVETTRPQ